MPRRPAPTSAADIFDQLRDLVELDGRTIAEIARGLEPPMSREQLGQILRGERDPTVRTLLRILRGLGPPRRLSDLDP